ncbi:UNVERIFIED_CONTAM: signal transduction histidine kinase [Acetivibrio alkalicellulosi]
MFNRKNTFFDDMPDKGFIYYRAFLVVFSIFNLFFYILQFDEIKAIDYLIIRFEISVLFFVIFILSYKVVAVQNNLIKICCYSCFIIISYYSYMAYINNFAADFTITIPFLIVITSFLFISSRQLIIYLSYIIAISTFLIIITNESQTNKIAYIIFLVLVAGVSFVFSMLIMDIQEKIKLQKNVLMKQNEEILRISTIKDEFIANISHEIRTPLNGIIMMTDLLKSTSVSEEQLDYLDTMINSSELLLNIINDILDFSKIEAKKLELNRVCFNLLNLITGVVKVYETKASKKGLEFRKNIPHDLPVNIIGDDKRFKQVIINLLDNAIKFTEKGFIEIGIDVLKRFNSYLLLQISIQDSGIGIEKDKINKIFDSFMQADGSISRNYGGTGLGLAISSRLVELMNGRIWVESQKDIGSTFHFIIKVQLPNTKEVDRDISKQSIYSLTDSSKRLSSKSFFRILLADDNEIIRNYLPKVLIQSGYHVDTVSNGKEAIDLIKFNYYNLILLDIQMPIKDGYATAEEIREYEKHTKTYSFIASLTANAMSVDIHKSKASGMDFHLCKPINIKEILYFIEELKNGRIPSGTSWEEENLSKAVEVKKDEDITTHIYSEEWNMDKSIEELFEKLDYNITIIDNLISDFETNITGLIQDIGEAIKRNDSKSVATLAHSLKGSLSFIKAENLYELALVLEFMGKENNLTDADDLYGKLYIEIPKIIAAMKKSAKVLNTNFVIRGDLYE